MAAPAVTGANRTFKTPSLAWSAKRAKVTDAERCDAILQVAAGRADDLGGGVFKKRLNGNMRRGILVGGRGTHWVFEYLFAKKDRDNVDDDELAAFRVLAKAYAGLTRKQWDRLVRDRSLLEICHDEKAVV